MFSATPSAPIAPERKHKKRMAQTATRAGPEGPEEGHLSCHARGTHRVPPGQALLHTSV